MQAVFLDKQLSTVEHTVPATDLQFAQQIIEFIDQSVALLCQMTHYSCAFYYFSFDSQSVYRLYRDKSLSTLQMSHAASLVAQLAKIEDEDSAIEYFLNSDIVQAELSQLLEVLIQSSVTYQLTAQGLEQLVKIVLCDPKADLHSESLYHVAKNYIEQRGEALSQCIENRKLQQTVAHLQEINLGRSKHFSVIAHDLRAPFHGILGCADVLAHERDTLDDEAAQRLADYIHDTTQSTYGLLENLLNWAMVESGVFNQRPVQFNLKERILFVIDLLNAFAFKKQIHLYSEVEEDLMINGDRNMITSIIQNLTSNALKFTPANGDRSVMISAQKIAPDRVEIIIRDEGVGMTPEQIDKLFKDYAVPSITGTLGEKGTGLGLVLCKRFLESHRGTIRVESQLNKGTQFIIELPTHMN